MNIVGAFRAITFLQKVKKTSVDRLSTISGVPRNTMSDWLERLEESGAVRRVGVDPNEGKRGTKPTLWELTE